MAHVADVVIDHTKVSADLTDFVVFVDLSDLPTTGFWDTVANGGGDIRCYKSDGTTELAREVVSCDTATDTGELHIRFAGTLSSSSDTTIQIHADGTSSEPAATATYGRNAAWSDYTAVWHLKASAPGTDSTGNGHDLSVTTGTLGSTAGPFGGDVNDYNGATEQNTNTAPVSAQVDITFQMWGDRDTTSDAGMGSTVAGSGQDGQGLQMRYDASGFSEGGSNVLKAAIDANQIETSDGSFGTGWHSFYTLRDGTSHKTYINGSLDDTASIASNTIGAWTSFYIGNGVKDYWTGGLAEARIRDDALTADWISTEYNNQSSPSTFYTASAVSGSTTITGSGAVQAQTLDQVALTQGFSLAPASLAHAQTADTVALLQAHNLAPAEAAHAQTADTVALLQAHNLAPAAVDHSVVGDPYFNDVALLLHMDGSDGSTTFTDSSSNAHPITRAGNTQIDTVQSKFGGAAALFDGSGDFLKYPAASFDFLATNDKDFTFECWARFGSLASAATIISRGEVNVGERAFAVFYRPASSGIRARLRDNANTYDIDSTAGIFADTWYHVAVVVEAGAEMRLYVDGVEQASISLPASAFTSTLDSTARIGAYGDPLASFPMNGHIDDLRITKGVARYTSNFTPPTAALPDFAAVSGHTVDAPSLSAATAANPDDAAHAQTADTVALTQAHNLTPAEAAHAQAADAIDLAQTGTANPDDAAHAQTADTAALTQAHNLAPSEAAHAQTLDTSPLTATGRPQILAQDATHVHAVAEALLTQAGVILPLGVVQAQTLDVVSLAQQHQLALDGALQAHGLESTAVSENALVLIPAGLTLQQALDQTALAVSYTLSLDSLTHAQLVDIVIFGGTVNGELVGSLTVYAALSGTLSAEAALAGEVDAYRTLLGTLRSR